MIPEWLAILCVIVGWGMGFSFAGIIMGKSPFWDGVRYVWSFGRKK